MNLSDKLLDKIANLPQKSGVYLMRDAGGHIIYIGKAVVLKNRVRQYFFNTQKDPKVQAMVDSVADFDYIITLSEKDALSLEANLVRKHKPRYNILLKDDKHSPYIRVDLKEKFPTLEVTRKIKPDGARYFGPFFFGVRVSEILDIIRSAYRVRCCPKKFSAKNRACLNYHIALCLSPCSGAVSEQEYRAAVDKVIAFLSGKDSDAEKILTQKMNAAVQAEDFERAILYRDRLAMLKRLKDRTLGELSQHDDMDAIAFARASDIGAVSVVIVRGGKLMGAKNYPLGASAILNEDGVAQALTQYYSDPNTQIPPEILVDGDECVDEGLTDYLTAVSGKKVTITTPKIGLKRKLVQMAEENARDCLTRSLDKVRREYEMCEGALKSLSEILGYPHLRRLECYDISHISGTDQVASGVVFIDGRAAKSEYRRYQIKTVEGSDDFRCLAEAVTRRLNRAKEADQAFSEVPDLIVIDGGKGQLSHAYAAMQDTGLDIPMIALAEKNEEIYTLFSPQPIVLKKESFALKLLQRLRDEAHRFAVAFHHSRRAKRIGSVLEKIHGVGAKKRAILLKAFPSVQAIAAADLETLAAVEGIDSKTAAAIVQFFQDNDESQKSSRNEF